MHKRATTTEETWDGYRHIEQRISKRKSNGSKRLYQIGKHSHMIYTVTSMYESGKTIYNVFKGNGGELARGIRRVIVMIVHGVVSRSGRTLTVAGSGRTLAGGSH